MASVRLTKVLEIDESGATASFQSQNFKVVRYCVRRRMKDSEVPEGDGPVLTMPRDHGMGSMGGDMGLTPLLREEVPEDYELGAGEPPTEWWGILRYICGTCVSLASLYPYPGLTDQFGKSSIP